MATRTKIPYQSSATVRLIAPTDVVSSPNDPLDNSDDGASCSFKVYDPAKDQVLSADEASGQTVLSVTNAAAFKVGDVVEATQDNGVLASGTLSNVNPSAGTITSSGALAGDAAAGNRVRVRLGGEIDMDEYGTPKLGTRDWGFQGSLPSDHPGLVLELDIDIEIAFIGDVGGGLDLIENVCAVIKRKEDCDD